MKKPLLVIVLFIFHNACSSTQHVGVGTSQPAPSALRHLSSDSKGLLIPRMSNSAVQSVLQPARGLLVFDTTNKQLLVSVGAPQLPG